MSSLADRLAAASRDRATPTTPPRDAMATMNERRGKEETKAETDFAALKSQVHNTLLQQLGPKLYDAELTQTELEHMVKGAVEIRDLVKNSLRTVSYTHLTLPTKA